MTTKRTILSVNGKQKIQVGFCTKSSACRILGKMGALRGDSVRIARFHVGYGKNLSSFDADAETFIF